MAHIDLSVTGMSCMGCVNSVKNLLGALPGIERVDIDLGSGQVAVDYRAESVTPEQMRQCILDGGYGVA